MECEGIDAFVWPQPASTFAPASDALAAELAGSGVAFVVLLVLGLAIASARPWRARWPLVVWAAALASCAAPFVLHVLAQTASRPPTPEDALTIHVRAYRWRWEFEQPNGMVDSTLWVPVGRPVRLLIRSVPNGRSDVPSVHAFSVPALRIRADAIPGRVTEVWFQARTRGAFPIYCGGFCGTGHSRMLSTLQAIRQDEYDGPWGCQPPMPAEMKDLADWGRHLFANNGCPACHHVDDPSPHIGPRLADVAGYDRQLADGSIVHAKAEYLTESIVDPQAAVAEGYDDVRMPAFNLPRAQLDALVAYLASISDRGALVAPPEPED